MKKSHTVLREFAYKDGTAVYMFAVIGSLAVQLVLGLILGAAGRTDLLTVDWVNMLFSMFLQVVFFAAIAVYCYVNRTRPELGIKPTHPANYGFSALVAVIAMIAFFSLAIAFDWLLQTIGYTASDPFVFDSLASKILGVIATCVAAPICEELIFRGALLSGLKKNFKEPVCVLLSGLTFALMHMNPEQTIYQFLLGCVLAYTVLKTGSLVCGMIGHCVSNLIAILIEFIGPFENALNAAFEYLMSIPLLFASVAVVLAAAGTVGIFFIGKLMGRLGGRNKEKTFTATPPVSSEEAQGDGGNILKKNGFGGKFYLIIGLTVCIVMWVVMLAVGLLPEGVVPDV